MDLIAIYFGFILVSFISYYMAFGLMRFMDYGGIFHWLRRTKFLHIASKEHKIIYFNIISAPYFSKDLKELEDRKDYVYATTRDKISKLMWEAIQYAPDFKLWLCNECMAVRLAFVHVLFLLIYCYFNSWVTVVEAIVMYLFCYPAIFLGIYINIKDEK